LSSEQNVYVTNLDRVKDYQFKVKFDLLGMPELLTDEPDPLGKNAGPNPSRLLSAAVGDCLTSSLLFCLSKERIAVDDLRTSLETVIRRNEKGRWRIAALKVKLHPVIREEDVSRSKRCLELFEDFCLVTESARKGIEVNVDVEMAPRGAMTHPRALSSC
jgi:organic hydroperoxide reductase OsmC/OhrA